MTLIYVLFMILFAYMAYGSGNVQNEIMAGIYTIGTFLMGVLALASTINNRKNMWMRHFGEMVGKNMKEKESNNGTVISD